MFTLRVMRLGTSGAFCSPPAGLESPLEQVSPARRSASVSIGFEMGSVCRFLRAKSSLNFVNLDSKSLDAHQNRKNIDEEI